MTNLRYNLIGHYIAVKMRERVAESGHFVVAKQLRRQGYPLWLARLILLGKQ